MANLGEILTDNEMMLETYFDDDSRVNYECLIEQNMMKEYANDLISLNNNNYNINNVASKLF